MIYGAFFVPQSEWAEAVAAGVRYCVRPVVTPDTMGNGDGFVTHPTIVDMATGAIAWQYVIDEPTTLSPAELNAMLSAAASPYFAVWNTPLGGWARKYAGVTPGALRGVNGYVGGTGVGIDLYNRTLGTLGLYVTALWWKNRQWVGVANSVQGGLLDRATSHPLPAPVLKRQIARYARLGRSMVWLWRWDVPWGKATIIEALR